MTVSIERPEVDDFNTIKNLLKMTIKHTFVDEQIAGDNQAEIEREVESHLRALHCSLESDGKDEHFLIARHKSEVVGIIAFGRPNRVIIVNLNFDSEMTPEVKCAYVLPDFQRKGIGNRLFDSIVRELHERDICRFCLDCGYKKAQKFWTKRLGPATVILPDYYGPNAPHLIWLCEVSHLV